MIELNLYAETRRREARNDPRATHEFVTIALTEPDEDAAWDTIAHAQGPGRNDEAQQAAHTGKEAAPGTRGR